LRGLHYQIQSAQGKLVRVLGGSICDVAVDIRKSSPTFSKWFAIELSESNNKMLWIPRGFAHGFLSLEDNTKVLYKTTDYWAPSYERTIVWNDADLAISWPLQSGEPLLSGKDTQGKKFLESEIFN
jgi:dTDP-4-dehydrorhamnose 3,5-epimerase